MQIQVVLENKGMIYDATPVLTGEVKWESSILGESGKLEFQVIRDGVLDFVEGNAVDLFVEGAHVFSGFVVSKARTSAQIITVTALDRLFYLAKNKETLLYYDKTASELIQSLAQAHGFAVGALADTQWKIPQQIEEGKSLLDMIFSALDITKKATGKEFFFFDEAGVLTLKAKEEMGLAVLLGCDGGISEYAYQTDISEGTYNAVKLYQAGRNEVERVAYETEVAEKVLEWGRLQYYAHIAYGTSQAQMQALAEQVLASQCLVKKRLLVENINADVLIRAGNSIGIHIPDLAEISLLGTVLVERCVHTFSEGFHKTQMQIFIAQ